ncbi:hypothetical protein Tco_0870484 [Tanacetum coccineum]
MARFPLTLPTCQADPPVIKQNLRGNSSSLKRVHFINTITPIRKEEEPKEGGILEPNATQNNDHDIIVEVEEKRGEEFSCSGTVIGEGESLYIKRDNPDDRACRDTKEAEEVEEENKESEIEKANELIEYEEPFDLVDTRDESVYESLIEKMPSCSLSFNFRNERGDPSNLKIPFMIEGNYIGNVYIDLDSPMNVMSLACYNAIKNQGYTFRGQNFIRKGKDIHVFVGNMSYVMDFTILENIEANIDPNGIKEVTFKTPYKDSEMDDLASEGHDLLSSRVILSEDDYKRGCKRASDLESGFYMDVDKLDLSYKDETDKINLDRSFEVSINRRREVKDDGGVT